MDSMKILLVEDDKSLSEITKKYLIKEEYEVKVSHNMKDALKQIENNEFNLFILDVMLPDGDGWSILRKIREDSNVPVIMLTARNQENDKLFGFELGCDDYVSKPFSNKLLIARIKAVLKRYNNTISKSTIDIDGLKINKDNRIVYIDKDKISLTPIEYDLLLYFVENINIALSRDKILNAVWGYDYYGDERTVDTHVKRLRRKLKNKSSYIETVRSYGYRMMRDK